MSSISIANSLANHLSVAGGASAVSADTSVRVDGTVSVAAQGSTQASSGATGGSSSDSASVSLKALQRQLAAVQREIAELEVNAQTSPTEKASRLASLNSQVTTIEQSILQLQTSQPS